MKIGQKKCPNCGSTAVKNDIKTGKLICEDCRTVFEPTNIITSIDELNTKIIGEGTSDIIENTNFMSFKCESCGSETSINTDLKVQATCPWCRSVLSVNMQIPNGTVPDMILPFKVSKEEAIIELKKFVEERDKYSSEKFKKEFNPDNITGMFLPYIIVDVKASARMYGQGEIKSGMSFEGDKYNKDIYYDADLFYIKREFDIKVDDLAVETKIDKLNIHDNMTTSNIINTIMPFDTENCVKWDANYVKGYTFEKRDVNISEINDLINNQVTDVIKHSVNDTLTQYNRGVRWKESFMDIKGQQWLTAFLPVWLYSFKDKENITHFIAINGRSKETMGSVPVNFNKLFLKSFLIFILGVLLSFIILLNYIPFIICTGISIIYFNIKYQKYRNKNKRHRYEKETSVEVDNLVKEDAFVKTIRKVLNSKIQGMNNETITKNEFIINELIEKKK